MKDILDELLIKCIQIGLTIDEFWCLDFNEIQMYFDAYAENKKVQMKEEAAMNWKLAVLTSACVGGILSGKKLPTLYDSYPELFKEEAEEAHWKAFQAQMLQYSTLWNSQNAKTGGPVNG